MGGLEVPTYDMDRRKFGINNVTISCYLSIFRSKNINFKSPKISKFLVIILYWKTPTPTLSSNKERSFCCYWIICIRVLAFNYSLFPSWINFLTSPRVLICRRFHSIFLSLTYVNGCAAAAKLIWARPNFVRK